MSTNRSRNRSAVPASRFSRVLRFGLLSGELALATAIGTAKQPGAGRRPDLVAAMLTPGNADLLRGASRACAAGSASRP